MSPSTGIDSFERTCLAIPDLPAVDSLNRNGSGDWRWSVIHCSDVVLQAASCLEAVFLPVSVSALPRQPTASVSDQVPRPLPGLVSFCSASKFPPRSCLASTVMARI